MNARDDSLFANRAKVRPVGRWVLLGALVLLSFAGLAENGYSIFSIAQTDAAKQQQLSVLRAQLQQANSELALNRSAQANPAMTESQRRQLHVRGQQLQQEIAALQAQERALNQETTASQQDKPPTH